MAAGSVRPRSAAARVIALARGCSLSASAAAASVSTRSSSSPSAPTMPVTAGSPMVSVPVLSKRIVSTVRICSSARRSLISTPPRAARSVAMDTTSGIARPSAWGQAITNTVTVRTTASPGSPMSAQTIAVITAAPSANQKSSAAALSAIRWARELEFWASLTRRRMPASAVSSPVAVTSTRSPESVATVPATTWSPTPRRTGFDSPVIIASSTWAAPSTMRPSAGTEAPGRTRTTSPTRSSPGAMVTTASPSTRSASSGSSAARESSAEVVCASERISIQCPSSMMTISSASSHQKSRWCGSTPRVAPQDARNATVMASPISSIMPGLRRRSSSTTPVRNGLPPQTYMTVPRTGETPVSQPASGRS